jgi:hypothetical protein
MELFAAGDRSQLDTIKKWIDESDVFMLVLGGRYGSIEEESKKSYVQLEYEYAIQRSKPLFAVVVSEGALERRRLGEDGSYVEQKAIAQYAEFRKLVLSKTSRFFDDPKDVRLAVFETLGGFSREREFVGGWVPAAQASHPQPLIDEIGRLTEENKELRVELEQARKKFAGSQWGLDHSKVFDALRKIKTKVPAVLVKKANDEEIDLLDLFFANAERFGSGAVHSHFSADEVQKFLYFTVAPQLANFGLVSRQRAANGKYSEFVTTPAGHRFLAKVSVAAAELRQAPANSEEKASSGGQGSRLTTTRGRGGKKP